MGCRDGNTVVLHVELSSFEAAHVSDFFEERIQRRLLERNISSVGSALDRLIEATAAAIWLRENVVWELTRDEALEVQEALATQPAKAEEQSHDRIAALDNILARLTHTASQTLADSPDALSSSRNQTLIHSR